MIGILRKQTGTFDNTSLSGIAVEWMSGKSQSGAGGTDPIVGTSDFNGFGSAT